MADRCPVCGAPVILARNGAGKTLPLDAAPHPDGVLELAWGAEGEMPRVRTARLPKEWRPFPWDWPTTYKSHFATCTGKRSEEVAKTKTAAPPMPGADQQTQAEAPLAPESEVRVIAERMVPGGVAERNGRTSLASALALARKQGTLTGTGLTVEVLGWGITSAGAVCQVLAQLTHESGEEREAADLDWPVPPGAVSLAGPIAEALACYEATLLGTLRPPVVQPRRSEASIQQASGGTARAGSAPPATAAPSPAQIVTDGRLLLRIGELAAELSYGEKAMQAKAQQLYRASLQALAPDQAADLIGKLESAKAAKAQAAAQTAVDQGAAAPAPKP
jgi:hypothetical protein